MAICLTRGSESSETIPAIPKRYIHEPLFVPCEAGTGDAGVINSHTIGTIRKILENIAPKMSDRYECSI